MSERLSLTSSGSEESSQHLSLEFTPKGEIKGFNGGMKWKLSTSDLVSHSAFTALCNFFGNETLKKLRIGPILLSLQWASTPVRRVELYSSQGA